MHVSREIDADLALAGLLHDAAEAYLGDVPSPLKAMLPEFKAYEWELEKAIGLRFDIDPKLFKGNELKRADTQLLIDEKAALMVSEPEQWPKDPPDVKDVGRIEGWGSGEAKRCFLAEFEMLTARH